MVARPPPPHAALRFGRFELQLAKRRLLIDSRPALLGPRAFDLLVVLAERPGELVGKSELLERVWPGMAVEEGNIAVQINALRKVLGRDLIGTVPGRGYRFTARVEGMEVVAASEPAPLRGPQTHLPRVLPALLGRASDLSALEAVVDDHPLVTVIGAGGIGKTLLVQHLLDSRRRAYPHGVCWVELAGVADAAALPATVAAALGVRLGGGDAFEALALSAGPLDLLLGLDNAEHLTDEVGRLAALLNDAAPRLKVVVTSQVKLGVATERVLRLATLDLPPPGAGVAQALATGAVALFVDRVQAADTRFMLTTANLAPVVEICRSLDGLALALELAAARAPTVGIHGLASSMGDRLQLLTRNRNRTAPACQQTLRATLEWSYAFLDATAQEVFRRLAVVEGSCSLQLAQQIASSSGAEGRIDAWAVLDALDVLVDRSLVAVLPAEDDATPRYRLLESPKAFAKERLAAAGESESTQLRFAQGMAHLLEHAWEGYFRGTTTISHLRQSLAPDFDNARSAIAWVRCPSSLRLQISAYLVRVLPHAFYAERLALADAFEVLLVAEPSLQLRMFGCLAMAVTWLNPRRQRSRAAAERAVVLAREHARHSGDSRYLHHALGTSAFAMALNQELDSASVALVEMRAIENVVHVPAHLPWRADAERIVAGLRGDYVERRRIARECVARAQASNDEAQLSSDMLHLIDAELAAGDAQAAATTGRALVAMLAPGGDAFVLTLARLNLCAALLELDALAEARAVAEAGWTQARRFELEGCWADYLALLVALEERPKASARLCGFADAAYAASQELREVSQAAAFNRARLLAASALGNAGFERLQAEGQALRYADIATIAFTSSDA